MAYTQYIAPNTLAEDATGMCLRFTQRVFQDKNPLYYNSAWDAWLNAKHRSTERNLPADASVPVWFSHWGTYGAPPRYDNWGHVVTWVPGVGYLSSPAGGYGQQWFSSIEEIERTFNAQFVGWSLDVGGAVVAWPKHGGESDVPPKKRKKIKGMMVYYANANGKGKGGWLVLGYTPNALILSSQSSANLWSAVIERKAETVGREAFLSYLTAAGGTAEQLKRVG